jgi:peptidase M28-like protein
VRFILAALLLVSCTSLPSIPAPTVPPSATIAASASPEPTIALGFDGERAHKHLAYLADPARGGRFTGSPGFEDAAGYVAERFKELGLEPLGDNGTYFQRFPVQLVDLAGTPTLSRTGANAKTWTHRVDFTESIGGRAGNGSADAKLAVVGGGAATNGQDDFSGVDVRGRIALVTGPTVTGYQEQIAQRGGVGILVVGESTIKYSYIAQQFSQTLPVLVVSEATANELLAPAGKTLNQVRDAVRARRNNTSTLDVGFGIDTNVQMSVPVTPVHQVTAMNVVGLLRASGPDASRAVLIGGHLDGVGTDPNGTVFAAANDNASGPSIAIEIARVLAAHKSELKRSVIFVGFAGEEEGFLGSEAYIARTSSSPGRVESLVAMLNLDVIGCCGDTLEGSNESRALQDRVRAAATRAGVTFQGVGGGGSDQQPFARRGVPAILVLWSDYILHTVKDTVDKVDVRHLQRAGDVMSAVALELARGEGP